MSLSQDKIVPIKLETNRCFINQIFDAEPKEILEIYNSNPDYIEAAELFSGFTQFSLDQVGLYIWQELNRENSKYLEIRFKDDNQLIGICYFIAPAPETNQPWIGNLLIKGGLQRKGLGTEILNSLLEYLKIQKWKSVTVSIFQHCQGMKDFYIKNGFEVLRADFDPDKRPVWIMEKHL